MEPDSSLRGLLDDLGGMAPYDVSARRAERLRGRCHAALKARRDDRRPAAGGYWARVAGPAVVAVCCAAYVLEMARLVAVIYRW